jgi:DNA mismatch repair protein MutS
MYKEYIELYKTYTQKYGPKTAIFLMVGSFYELYDIQCSETGETVCNVREIVEYLGIQLTTKKGDISFTDFKSAEGLFAGFPDYVMHKWAGRLTSAGFNVVVVDQIKDMKGKVKERKVARILSPSTHIENTSSVDTPYVMTLFFDYNVANGASSSSSSANGGAPSFGAALLDLTTGSTRTYTGKATGNYDMWTADDIVQLWSIFQPKELIVYSKNSRTNSVDETFFRRLLGFTSSTPCYIHHIDSIGSFGLPLVCQEYLQKVYSPKTVLPIKTYLGIRSNQEQTALLYLLQFVEEHYPSMLKSFQRNEPWIPTTQLICGNHALTQLQMTSQSDNKQESVVGLFDKCITVMGKRAIKERLLRPLSHSSEIDRRLTEVAACTEWPQDMTTRLLQQLRFLYDIPRLHRKIQCGIIPSKEIFMLFQSYTAAGNIMTILKDTVLQSPFSYSDLQRYLAVFQTHFTENKFTENDITVFNVETYKDIGIKELELAVILQEYENLKREFIRTAKIPEDAVRLEERDKDYGFKCSTVILQHLKKNVQQLPKNTKFTELKSGGWIDCAALQQLNHQLIKVREQLQQLTQIHMIDACLEISQEGQKIWGLLEDWLSHVDVTQCIARVSMERGYIRPIILEDDSELDKGAEFSIKQIRHPLVEAMKTRVEYVQHDVALNQETKGWLVYGMNASGKSTLMKATGICILLAQAGCFVPAKEMQLRPFKAIYTRILNQDNLFAGLSSFAVEMSELRDILRNADKNTLVLGDELCSGTESTSAQALVASGIKWLTSKAAKFIFATHLHQLPELITTQDVTVLHLHVDYDPVTKKLIYDRTLRPGNGSTLYGLEVARAMDLPMEFIEQALEFRHKIIGSTTHEKAKSSSWNKEIVRKECDVCKLQLTSDLEVHHVSPRAAAVNKITQNGMHMNDVRNLVVVCQACHDAIHADKIEIGAVKMTSDGPERIIQKEPGAILTSGTKKSKWTEEEMQIMTDTVKRYASLSLKAIKGVLYSKYEIEVGETILSKIRKSF